MAKGMEGLRMWRRGAETVIIAKETNERTPESIIAEQRKKATSMLDNFRLVSALSGEELFPLIAEAKEAGKKLAMATSLMNATPFVKKLMPDHFDEDEMAGIIVGLSEVMQSPDNRLH